VRRDDSTEQSGVRPREVFLFWFAVGIIFLLIESVFVYRSLYFSDESRIATELIPSLLLLLGCAAFFYFYVVKLLAPRSEGKGIVLWILLVGILLRGGMFFLSPIRETDFYRYFWDGAVTAHGVNPYAYSPADVRNDMIPATDPNASVLQGLARESDGVLEKINNPTLRTIYPPAAQSLFCAAYWMTPFKLTGWRVVLSIFDLIAILAVGILLWRLGKSSAYLAVYFWNPLLIYETYYNCHLDLAASALVITFVAFLVLRQHIIAAPALALAVGIKLWPIVLFPFLMFGCRRHWLQVLLGLVIFAGLIAVWFLSFQPAVQNPDDSGVFGFTKVGWSNPGAYRAIHWASGRIRDYFALQIDRDYLGWLTVLCILLLLSNIFALRSRDDSHGLIVSMGILMVMMILLSPVVYPWYYIAIIPLAAAESRWAFLLWTILLPISYLPAAVVRQQDWIPWLIHVPIWLLVIGGWVWRMKKEQGSV